jgi:hypothetical protein
MSVVFLLSSLPTLEPGGEAPLSVEEYRSRCECVSSINLSDFDAVAAGTAGSHPFTVAYSNAITEIKNATAFFRASKWEGVRISERSHSNYHVSLRQKIIEACNIQNPFEREVALARILWQMVEELAGMAYFSAGKAYAYIVKLQINARLASLNNELGKQVIEEFIKANDHEVVQN